MRFNIQHDEFILNFFRKWRSFQLFHEFFEMHGTLTVCATAIIFTSYNTQFIFIKLLIYVSSARIEWWSASNIETYVHHHVSCSFFLKESSSSLHYFLLTPFCLNFHKWNEKKENLFSLPLLSGKYHEWLIVWSKLKMFPEVNFNAHE